MTKEWGNGTPAPNSGGVTQTVEEIMDAMDKLPKEWREFMGASPITLDPVQALDLYRQGLTLERYRAAWVAQTGIADECWNHMAPKEGKKWRSNPQTAASSFVTLPSRLDTARGPRRGIRR